MYRKGYTAGNAAVLVAIVAALIILYILFLPPDVREDLLDNGNGNNNGDSFDYNETPLVENPGRLDYLKFDQRDHTLPSFRIFATKEGRSLKSVDSLYVKDGAFEDVIKEVEFTTDIDLTENLLLSFNVEKADGPLVILLNGREIFNKVVEDGSPKPVVLSKDLLEFSNTLTFKTTSPGAAFWRVHEYQLSNIAVTADVLDLSNSNSEQHFFITEQEYVNLEKATIFFYPRCDESKAGKLSIYLNEYLVYSTLADCGVLNSFTISKDDIFEGDNSIAFQTTQGSYLIDNLKVKTDLEELIYPVYYFELEEDLFEVIDEDSPDNDRLDPDYEVLLKMRFPDNTNKKADIYVNGRKIFLDTDSQFYERNINQFVIHRTNSIEIIPKKTVDIQQLLVEVND